MLYKYSKTEQILSPTASLYVFRSMLPRFSQSHVRRFVIGVFPVFGPARRLLHPSIGNHLKEDLTVRRHNNIIYTEYNKHIMRE